ncbi:hypothetical protein [Pseudofrankia sp. BMG5.37]|uniref:hypothetical protein n=1 Tax=Pseudofrankia sp. BMG5.37 TaxID=3050035 RepID=UPI0028946908|nr:hypothetical protein [Pseudofrankia sp. BMG5.37]MDT3446386.1 hypothetical protein [Pseudofrankia sp. BMG5.37]
MARDTGDERAAVGVPTPNLAAILNQLNTVLLTQYPDSERFLTVAHLDVRESRRGAP